LTVDGVHFKTYESRKNPTAKVYSHKSNGPAMSYEIAIAIHESRVLAINGPFDASTADITIFRDQLCDAMPEGKRGIGDSGYQGEPGKLTFHRPAHSKEMTNFINRVGARHENFNARIKNFISYLIAFDPMTKLNTRWHLKPFAFYVNTIWRMDIL
jgi:hypothetical protein